MTKEIDESIKSKLLAAILTIVSAQQCDALKPTFHPGRTARRVAVLQQMAKHGREAGHDVQNIQPSKDDIIRQVWNQLDAEEKRMWHQLDSKHKNLFINYCQSYQQNLANSLNDYISEKPSILELNDNIQKNQYFLIFLRFIKDSKGEVTGFKCILNDEVLDFSDDSAFQYIPLSTELRITAQNSWKFKHIKPERFFSVKYDKFVENLCKACNNVPIGEIKTIRLYFNGKIYDLKQIRPGIREGKINPREICLVFK